MTPIRVATNTPEPPIKVGPSNGIVASIVFIRWPRPSPPQLSAG